MSLSLSGQRPLGAYASDAPVVALALRANIEGSRLRVREAAAVRFQGDRRLDSYRGGAEGVAAFVGGAPVVGHGVGPAFAAVDDPGADLPAAVWDVGELAAYVAPEAAAPSLTGLYAALGLGDPRADGPGAAPLSGQAEMVRLAYLELLNRARAMPGASLRRMAAFLTQGQSPLAALLTALADAHPEPGGPLLGVDREELQERLPRPRYLGDPSLTQPSDPDEVERLLSADGPFAARFLGFEPRPEQVEMARAVAEALATDEQDAPHHLLVEGGTGIGKSVAYLLPIVLFALRNNARVVVSTNTINLQEQLIGKDLPEVVDALRGLPGLDLSHFRYTQLKGKANYLCLRRWQDMAAADALSPDEARTMAKTLGWLRRTRTGDRSELPLEGRETAVFERLSASGFSACTGAREGACFYRHAREEAAAAHVVVVNHALLLSDLIVGGSLLPPYDFLVIDEAHNLEAEATRQFGFRIAQGNGADLFERCGAIVQTAAGALRASPLSEGVKAMNVRRVEAAQEPLQRAQTAWTNLMTALTAFAKAHRGDSQSDDGDLRVTPAVRANPAWSGVEVAWDAFDHSLADSANHVDALRQGMDALDADTVPGLEERKGELIEWLTDQRALRGKVGGFMARPDESFVYWLSGLNGALTMNGAPLDVAAYLSEALLSQKHAVVLTSATLTVRGDFRHLRERLGLEAPFELCLGSPFDYERAALLCVPTDVPEPNAPAYAGALADALRDLARAAGGRTMALFTSHASLRATASALQARLRGDGIGVLAQGVHGAPPQLAVRFQQEPRSVLLGAASFWEGVDIGNASLKVLVLARLPFNVPTEPIFAARSELYEKPFFEYAAPQAVLRFRQGFGRLIRSKTDRGAVVVLDARIVSKSYGALFLNSLPPTVRFRGPLAETVWRVRDWLGGAEAS